MMTVCFFTVSHKGSISSSVSLLIFLCQIPDFMETWLLETAQALRLNCKPIFIFKLTICGKYGILELHYKFGGSK